MKAVRMSQAMLFTAVIVSLVIPSPLGQRTAAAPADPAFSLSNPPTPSAPLDTPTAHVPGFAAAYTIASPVLYWYSGVPGCPPAAPSAPQVDYQETIQRVATYGSPTRTLYNVTRGCGSADMRSNLVSDGAYLYWISTSRSGLVRLSTQANPGDQPELISDDIPGVLSNTFNLLQDGNTMYVLVIANGGALWSVNMITGVGTILQANAGAYPGAMQADGYGLYWLASGVLQRMVWGYGPPAEYVKLGVDSFYADTYYLFYGKGASLYLDDLYDGIITPLYTSVDPSARITWLIGDSANLYFFERRTVPCNPQPCFPNYAYVLFRMGRDGSSPSPIYSIGGDFSGFPPSDLKMDGDFLFWRELAGIYRLPKNASALPVINLRITGMEINQSVQRLDNSVRLIQGKRTFVRVYVKSDGASVSGVTALLYLTDAYGEVISNALLPANPGGTRLRVRPSPLRSLINDSFLFELPWSWVEGNTLRLHAVLNPYKVPLEPNYSDNQQTSANFNLAASPRLAVQFVGFGYSLNNTNYYPLLATDIVQTYSWIRRSYPLASKPGFFSDPTPGFRPNLWYVFDDGLGSRVNQTASECSKMSDPTLCASAYVNGLLTTMRKDEGVPDSVFLYGMISDRSGIFPRGGEGGGGVSSGPAGPVGVSPANFGSGWDKDSTYADWYAGHEIGHSLGRAHPNPASDDPATPKTIEGCGHSRSDPNYTYPNAQISPADNSLEGLDTGDAEFDIPVRIMPGNSWFDNMSYCSPKWWSDYTYNGLYDAMLAKSKALALRQPRLDGDFLSLFGVILPGTDKAFIQKARRLSSVASAPFPTPGGYSLRLVGGGSQLAEYPFSPTELEDSNGELLSFAETVNFEPRTQEIRIVRISDEKLLASLPVSANPPVIASVTLPGLLEPASGTINLAWSASDPDGDPLTFDIYYSRGARESLQPLQLGVSGNSLQVDTSRLGGGTAAFFRVTASDGVQTATADSPVFEMAVKAPQVRILQPGDGHTIQYGQLVNFLGEADDFQDGGVADASLTWSTPDGVFGNGPAVSADWLKVGANEITLTAVNSAGVSASQKITVYVVDDLSLPGPTLHAGPDTIALWAPAGSTTPLSAEVSLANLGSGELNWTAEEDADWLSLNSNSGAAPAVITLTLNPAGMADGSVRLTTLWLNAEGYPAQRIGIPVSLALGDQWYRATPAVTAARLLFLPLIGR